MNLSARVFTSSCPPDVIFYCKFVIVFSFPSFSIKPMYSVSFDVILNDIFYLIRCFLTYFILLMLLIFSKVTHFDLYFKAKKNRSLHKIYFYIKLNFKLLIKKIVRDLLAIAILRKNL